MFSARPSPLRHQGHSRRQRGIAVVQIVVFLTATTGCIPRRGLPPSAGHPAYQAALLVPVPGGHVNSAGGNLLLRRVDLSLDTRIGRFELTRSYSSAARAWTFSPDMRLTPDRFLDATGAAHALNGVEAERIIPGTDWVRMGPGSVRTRGGLVHAFGGDGALRAVHWLGDEYPRLVYRTKWLAGAARVTAIDQCTAPDACQPLLRLRRDAKGRIVRATDRAERRCAYAWGAGGQLLRARDGRAMATGQPGERFVYDAEARVSSWESAEGERVEVAYARERVRSVRAPGEEAPEWRFAYGEDADTGLFFTRVWDPLGHEQRFRYDADRRIRDVELSGGERLVFEWEGRRLIRFEDLGGLATWWEWQGDDPLRRVDARGNVTVFSWEPRGRRTDRPFARALARAEDRLGLLEARRYDEAGRLVEHTNAAGETTRIAYGTDGLASQMTSPDGVVTRFFEYGEHGHPGRVERAGVSDLRAYDAVGNLLRGRELETSESPGRPGVLERRFDAGRALSALVVAGVEGLEPTPPAEIRIERRSDGRPLRVLRPHGGETEYRYDPLGRLVLRRERVSGSWLETRWHYDALGRVIARELPNGTARRDAWDALGRLVERSWLRDGVVERSMRFAYRGTQVIERRDPDQPLSEVLAYDGAGRLRGVRFAHGEELRVTTDLRGRVAREEFVDDRGRVQRVLAYRYDGLGRQIAIQDGGLDLVTRSFRDGRLEEERTGAGLVRRYGYDPDDGSLRSTRTWAADGRVVAESELENARRCRSILTSCRALRSWTEVDGGTELWEIAHLWPRLDVAAAGALPGTRAVSWSAEWSESYLGQADQLQYDALGNLSIAHPGAPADFVYNAERNRLLAGAGHRYEYDAAGMVVRRDDEVLAWDAQGRIAAVGDRMRFEWDALARPVMREVAGVATHFRFAGRVQATPDGRWQVLHAPGVQLHLATEGRRHEHRDARGNVGFLSDERGRVVTQLHYHAYGVEGVHGEEPATRSFAGGEALGDLVLLGARLYEPAVARFLAPDPVHQLVNQYAYTLGNPYWLWDPDGLSANPVTAAALTAYGISIARHGVELMTAGLIGTGLVVATVGAVLVLTSLAIAALQGGGFIPDATSVAPPAAGTAPGAATAGSADDGSDSAAGPSSACAPSRLLDDRDPGRSFWVLGALQGLAFLAWWWRRRRRVRRARRPAGTAPQMPSRCAFRLKLSRSGSGSITSSLTAQLSMT